MNTIKLFGIGGEEYKELKKRLNHVLQQLKINSSVEEINDVDLILEHGVSSVPSLLIGNKELKINGTIPDVEQIKNYLRNHLNQKNTMKKILVPTDFSESAHSAYLYARAIAAKLGASIQVLHAYVGSFSTSEMLVVDMLKGREEVLLDRLKAFCNYVPENNAEVLTKVDVSYEVVSAMSPAAKIVTLSSEADLIVMGASGEHDVIDKLFGSISSTVAQKAKCPVLLVPQKLEFSGLDRLVYASNWESVNPQFIKEITQFGAYFGSGIDFVHIDEEKEKDDYDEMEETIFNTLFQKETPAFRFNFLKMKGNRSPLQRLHQYADQQSADLIVLVNRQDGLLSNVLGNSMTKEMAIKARYPILVYQYA